MFRAVVFKLLFGPEDIWLRCNVQQCNGMRLSQWHSATLGWLSWTRLCLWAFSWSTANTWEMPCCRVLKTWHKVAGDKVIALMGYDLVSAKNKWAAGIKELRQLFIQVEQDGFTMQSQAVWRLHWDHQIHKVCTHSRLLSSMLVLQRVLEHAGHSSIAGFSQGTVVLYTPADVHVSNSEHHGCVHRHGSIHNVCSVLGNLSDLVHFCFQALAYQYRCSLESINDNLAQIDVSLAVKHGRLQFEPPLEEIHVAHYKNQLRPLLAIPLNFKVGLLRVWTSQTVYV